jgi:flagellar basal body-associated protein FliL
LSSVSASGGRRGGVTILAVVLAIVAVLCAVAGVIYLTKTAGAIPSFLPGKEPGKNAHHTIRGIGLVVVAVALFVVAGIAMTRGGKSRG